MARLALIGDYNAGIVAHRAIPLALELAAKNTGVALTWDWVGTETITDAPRQLAGYAGFWCAPGSPYRSLAGALAAIRFAREAHRPFLGTCGGFQHALIEFARNVVGLHDADHAETNAAGRTLVVTPLSCSMVDRSDEITFTPGSRLHTLFAGQPARGEYHCNFGPNPSFRPQLESAGLRFTGFAGNGDIRAGELVSHPFFLGVLFQPERSALHGARHPVIEALVRATANK